MGSHLKKHDDLLTPPVLFLPNVEIDIGPPVSVFDSLFVSPLCQHQDESLFSQLLDKESLAPLSKDDTFANRAVVYVKHDDNETCFELLDRFRNLLALHVRTDQFDPADVQTVMLQFVRSSDVPADNDLVLVDRRQLLTVGELRQRLLGQCIIKKKQRVHVDLWDQDVKAEQPRNYGAELFAWTLECLCHKDVPGLDEALRLFSFGIQQHGEGNHEVAAVLIVSAFENLFPTKGKDGVLSQFKAIGCMLVNHPKIETWFNEIYDFRSSQVHGPSDDKKKRKMEQKTGRLVRDIELAKVIFQFCAYQLSELRDLAPDHYDQEDFCPKLIWWNYIDGRIGMDNISICDRIVLRPGIVKDYTGPLFDPYDNTASFRKLHRVGIIFLCHKMLDLGDRERALATVDATIEEFFGSSDYSDPLRTFLLCEIERVEADIARRDGEGAGSMKPEMKCPHLPLVETGNWLSVVIEKLSLAFLPELTERFQEALDELQAELGCERDELSERIRGMKIEPQQFDLRKSWERTLALAPYMESTDESR